MLRFSIFDYDYLKMQNLETIKNEFLNLLGEGERKSMPEHFFMEGDGELLLSGLKVSVVGSRNVSPEGQKRAEIITKELVKNDIVVVSGLAEGVDTIAHTVAINEKGRTIAVLGTPLNVCYPAINKPLYQRIKRDHLLVSQFPEGSRIYQSNFPARNKTMALISDATIIIEASEKSGTRHQAVEAIRLGRQLFILENVFTTAPKWANDMLRYGAIKLSQMNYKGAIAELTNLCFAPL